jgi:hypothetical protein
MLITGVLLFQIIRSFLESGLIDATPSFFLFMIMTSLAESGSRTTLLQAAKSWPDDAAKPPEVPSAVAAPPGRPSLLRR